MKEALLVRCDGTYQIFTYQKTVSWRWNGGQNPIRPLSEWDMVRRVTYFADVVPVRNILTIKGMCIWKGDHLEQPINKFATALQRVNYLPDDGDIRGNVLITGNHTYPTRTNRANPNPTIRLYMQGCRGTGTIKTLGKRKIKLLIQRLELANKLGKFIIPTLEKEPELSTRGVVVS